MAQNKPFKVVIAGGSITGLTLANMLQANNIDYVVLEAYPTIAPQVGASIGLIPHGNRILDQLGVFDKLLSLSSPIDTFTFRDEKAYPIAACHDVNRSFCERHGFPILFLDRQTLLQVLYEAIKDKSKILTGKRVVRVELTDNGSTAITADGSRYTGDIVIGGDGVHSKVRDEMWRLANELEPGAIDASEAEEVSVDYKCIFGISTSCPGLKAGDMNSLFKDKASYLVIGGKGDRCYWFRFQKYPKRLHGSEIPRFTEAEMQETIKAALHEDIFPGVKFSTLIENQVSSTVTPLVEHVYKRWHFRRVMTVGDSCHKFHPIGGQGGNAAIETSATLVNHLAKALKESPTGHLTTSQIDDLFTRVNHLRSDRAKGMMNYSHKQQRTESLDGFFNKIKALYLLPLADKEDVMFNFSSQIPPAPKLEMLPVQRQERLVPFNDELLRAPTNRGPFNWLLITLYVTLSATVYYGMWILPERWNLTPLMLEVIEKGTYREDQSFELVRHYTGIAGLDEFFVFLAVIFMPGLRAFSESFRTHQFHFLSLIGQPIVIWTIESFRHRNALTLLAIPSIWFALFQTTGIGVFMPLYYAAYTWISDADTYWWPLNRRVPIHSAKVLLPAGLLGYFLPTALMFYPWSSSVAAQYAETFWQPSPLYVPVLTMIFGSIYRWLNPATDEEKRSPRAKEVPADVAYLKNVYVVIGVLGVLQHWYTLLFDIPSTGSLGSVFIPNYSLNPMPLADGIHNIFLADWWGFVTASYLWCVSAVWDLKRVGRTNASTINAAVIILAAHVVLGPGAAMCAVWYWREDALAARIFPSVGKLHKD